MKVVGKFKYNDTCFVILNDNNSFKVGKIINGKIVFNFNEVEKEVIKEVVSNLAPKGEIVEAAPITINNNKYNVYHDNETNLFFFSPQPSEIDLVKLNNIFNNMSEFAYIPDKSVIVKDAFKRFVTLGTSVIVVTLASTVLLSTGIKSDIEEAINASKFEQGIVSQTDKLIHIIDDAIAIDLTDVDDPLGLIDSEVISKDNVSDKEKNNETPDANEEVKDYQGLIDAIKKNPNFSDYEKEVLTSNEQVFKDNFDYMNPEVVSKSKTVTVKDNVKMDAEGRYTTFMNQIEYSTSVKDTSNLTISHEYGHLLQYLPSNHNSFLTEGLNALFNDEYYGSNYAYTYQKNIMRCLAEIIGADNLRRINYQQSDQELILLLNEIIPDEKMNREFLAKLREYNSISFYGDEETKYEALNRLEQEINSYIRFLYSAKYSREADEDLIMLLYLDSGRLRVKIAELYNLNDPSMSVLFQKVYFNTELRNGGVSLLVIDCPNESLEGSFDQEDILEMVITINDDNRYLSNPMNR